MTHRGPFQPLLFCDSVKEIFTCSKCKLKFGNEFLGQKQNCLNVNEIITVCINRITSMCW